MRVPVAHRSRTVVNRPVHVILAFMFSFVSHFFSNEILQQKLIIKNTNIFRKVQGQSRGLG